VEDYVIETNLVRMIDAYVDTLDLPALGFFTALRSCLVKTDHSENVPKWSLFPLFLVK